MKRTIFREHDLLEIAKVKLTRAELTNQESEAAFDKKQCRIMRVIGTTLPSNRLQQVDHHETGTEMWTALCVLYEKRQNAAIRESTILRLSEELKDLNCYAGGDVQVHVNNIFIQKTELVSYGYEVNNINMKSMLLKSLPDQHKFEQRRGAVKYGGHGGTLTPKGLWVLIEEAADRQSRRKEMSAAPEDVACLGADDLVLVLGVVRVSITEVAKVVVDDSMEIVVTQKRVGQMTVRRRKNQSNFTHSGLSDQSATHTEPGIVASATEEAYNSGVNVHTRVDDGSEVSGVSIGSPSHAWWCFDTGSNAHIVGELDSFVHMEDIVPENIDADVYGVAHSMATQAEGTVTVKITSVVDGRPVDLFIDGALYVPGDRHGLFSMGFVLEQGLEVDYDRSTRIYSVFKDNVEVIHAYPAQGIWMFDTRARTIQAKLPQDMPVANYAAADGVGGLQVWHDRLGHTCAQYLQVMVDRGLQKQKRRRKKLDRGVTAPNEIVYADLLFPGHGNGTRYKAVLVIMDGWSRFLTVHLLTSKEAALVNKLMQQYVIWAETQAGRGIKMIIQQEFDPAASAKFPVQRVLTDNGGECVNGAMKSW
ncbi:unnamed protein product [Phytophthora fragariaefolia]|uniref:Unnamed protein product n=1 Tax=Phytophthora fragariaefolia TaxID=1490495 RepID=A0A9W6XSW1_9STRA|nr:unnamed protein product [Phytophthora fragariaefolia]